MRSRSGLPRKRKRELERVPLRRQPRIDEQCVAARPDAREAEGERLPDAAHRRQVETAGGGAGQVVEVDPSGDPQRVERLGGNRPARARSAAWMAGESELPWAVRGS